jgi:glycosyltransferase involved in cell wall biosynthesis
VFSPMRSVCMLVQNDYQCDPRVRRKAEALIAAGYSVDVLALPSFQREKTYTLAGVNVQTLALARKRGSLARYLFEYAAFFLWALVRVSLQMRRRRYAIIDVNTLPDLLIFAPILARGMGAKLVLDMHEITPEFYTSKYGIRESSWILRLLKRLEKISFDFADHVITVNDPIQDLLVDRGLPRSKSTVVMNTANEAIFTSCSSSSDAAAGAPPTGKFVMMYHGTVSRMYGLDIGIDAFDMVHEEMPGAELWILGVGTEVGSVESLAKQRGLASKVRLFPPVVPTELPAWLGRCDIGILPMRGGVYLDWAFPNKLSEYIAMGKPVVVPRLKAVRHHFSEEALAYFHPNDPADLAKQMVRVYRDPALRARLAARATEEYAPIRWDVMKRRYLSLMEGMLDPGATRHNGHELEATGLPR